MALPRGFFFLIFSVNFFSNFIFWCHFGILRHRKVITNHKTDIKQIEKVLDIGVFYMSSISAMGPHFFHWNNKLWVRGGRSRLALSENIENYFGGLSMTGSCPQNLPTWETHLKYALVYFLENQKDVVNPMVWRCREFFFSKIFGLLLFFSTRFVSKHRKVMTNH